MAPKNLSPREFLKARRPEKFSDSVVKERKGLNRLNLEYHLDSLTSRSQEIEFEHFARRLAEKEICPNLLPHTGPTGGGDSKVDAETYPVADAVALVWLTGIGREAANERWAFAFSAKKQWQDKLKSDVAKIVATQRPYVKAFFITNQYVPDRFRAKVEDTLTTKYGVDVRVLDRTWILNKVFGNGHQALAIEELRLDVATSTEVLQGPLDLQKKEKLERIECRIKDAINSTQVSFAFVNDCLKAAELARSLELPRTDIDGRFLRAKRVANEHGTKHYQILALYQWAWTTFWWFEDYKLFTTQYEDVENLARGSDNVYHFELLSNLWSLLQSSIRRQALTIAEAGLDHRTATLLAELERIAQQEHKPGAALQAEALRLLAEITTNAPTKATETLLNALKGVVERSAGLIGFPLEPLVEILAELGDYLGDKPAYSSMYDAIVAIVAERSGEIAAAQMMLKRGSQHLDADKPYDAIRSFGRALGRLYKNETRHELIHALYLCGAGYERVGLFWAARGVVMLATSLAGQVLLDGMEPSSIIAACYEKLRWLELRLGRIAQALAWHEIYCLLKGELAAQGYDLRKYDICEASFDAIMGILILKTALWQLKHLTRMPDTLRLLQLVMSAEALCFALGHEAALSKELFASGTASNEIFSFFVSLRDQPAADDLPSIPELYEARKATLQSTMLGCRVTVETDLLAPCIELAESIMAALESLFATGIQDGLMPREPSLTISIRIGDFVGEQFEYELKDCDGRPHLEVKCAQFDANSVSRVDQTNIHRKMETLLIKVLARITFVEDLEKTGKKMFKDDEALQRAVHFTSSFVVLGNALGESRKCSINNWMHPTAMEFPVLRDQEWDAADRRRKRETIRSKMAEKWTAEAGEPPAQLVSMETAKHTDIQLVSLIRLSLWDDALWSATAFCLDPEGKGPPLMALVFKNGISARNIFTQWHNELGDSDGEEKLRITIIRGINKRKPHDYRIVVGANPERMANTGPGRYTAMISRMLTLKSTTGTNLDDFIAAFKKSGSYYLAMAVAGSGYSNPVVDMKNSIAKTELNLRQAWQIGPNDLDRVGVQAEDDPLIPADEQAPVIALMKAKGRT